MGNEKSIKIVLMTPELSDFVSTYTPKQHPEPFFGFFKDVISPPKRITFRPGRLPMHEHVGRLHEKGHSKAFIAEKLEITKRQVQQFIWYRTKIKKI